MPAEAVIYLDHHATTPVDPRVLDRMLPYFTERFGNAASRTHRFGWDAQAAVDRARKQVAAAIGAQAREVIFTSGATEANALAINGAAEAAAPDRRHLVTVSTEHAATLAPCRQWAARGWRVTELTVGADGLLDLERASRAITPDTALVSVMLAHNEIGVIQPVAEVAALAHAAGALMHTDAVQALGKIPLDVTALGVDLASFSAHKLYGPKGVGALYVRRGSEPRLTPQVRGGGQERGLRGGTLNVPGLVGMGEACALALREMPAEAPRLERLRDRLWSGLTAALDEVSLNGARAPRLPGNLNVSFAAVDGEALLQGISEVAVSSGAACLTAEPSHVLIALGHDRARALASLRFGLGRDTTAEDIDRAVAHLTAVVAQVRGMSLRPRRLVAAGH
jgi:cysteine desulfurase